MGKRTWSEEDTEYLKEHWWDTPKEEILEHLKPKSWASIYHKTSRLKLIRNVFKPNPANKTWSDEEIKYLQEHYWDTPEEEILMNLKDKTWCSVISKANKINLKRKRGKYNFPEKDKIHELYWANGMSQAEIAKELNIPFATVNQYFNHYNIPTRNFSEAQKIRQSKISIRPPKEELEDLYINQKMTFNNIAKKLGVGETTIRRWCNYYGIKARNPSDYSHIAQLAIRNKTWSDEDIEYLKEHYWNTPKEEILEHLPGKTWNGITAKAWKLRIKRKQHDPPVKFTSEQVKALWANKDFRKKALKAMREAGEKNQIKIPKETLYELYWIKKLSKPEIAKELGISLTTVDRLFKEYDIPLRNHSEALQLRHSKRTKRPARDILDNLYWKKGLSYNELSKLFGVTERTIGRWFKFYNIKLRRSSFCYTSPLECDDGHLVYSTLERKVDNWLYAHRILHAIQVRVCSTRNWLADFKVGEYFIEADGLADNRPKGSRERFEEKLCYYDDHVMKYVIVYPDDDLYMKLGFLIREYSGIQRTLFDFVFEKRGDKK